MAGLSKKWTLPLPAAAGAGAGADSLPTPVVALRLAAAIPSTSCSSLPRELYRPQAGDPVECFGFVQSQPHAYSRQLLSVFTMLHHQTDAQHTTRQRTCSASLSWALPRSSSNWRLTTSKWCDCAATAHSNSVNRPVVFCEEKARHTTSTYYSNIVQLALGQIVDDHDATRTTTAPSSEEVTQNGCFGVSICNGKYNPTVPPLPIDSRPPASSAAAEPSEACCKCFKYWVYNADRTTPHQPPHYHTTPPNRVHSFVCHAAIHGYTSSSPRQR